ncbi:MAG: helix-turn-helix transcriptional regulator [Anaerolineae bacterium]|jgi:transcriptional regulator with XRE-family HTH domain
MADQEAVVLRDRIIGVLLKDARRRAGRSKQECADVLGVSPSTISAFEHGQSSISLPELEVLSYFLGVPISHFLDPDPQLLPDEDLPPVDQILQLRHQMLGVLLRQARTEARMSQQDLAEVLDCSDSSISDYERGRRPIPLAELEILAQTLERRMDYFLEGNDGPIGEWQREQAISRAVQELPAEMQEFVSRPINRSYLELAMKLAQMPAGALRRIAEGLLEITY